MAPVVAPPAAIQQEQAEVDHVASTAVAACLVTGGAAVLAAVLVGL